MDYNTLILERLNKEIDQQFHKINEDFQKFLNSLLSQNLPLETCQQIYNKALSFRQSNVSMKGKIFEDTIESILKTNKINYCSRVYVEIKNNEAFVTKKRTNIKVDFIVNLNNETIKNQNIKDLIVLSCAHKLAHSLCLCKFTCRERYKQDDWTLKYQPFQYYLLVGSDDYPKNFINTNKKKLITFKNKENDFNFLIDNLKPKTKQIQFIDLCCGIGSFHYSMTNINKNSKCVLACDILKSAQNTYKENYNIEPLNDLTKIKYLNYNADVVFSGNPCQSFSNIGNRKGLNDERGNLFLWIIENIINLQKYPIFVFENVANLLTIGKGEIFKQLKTRIEDYNYIVWYKVLLCSDYGIPQNRKRIFIICVKNGYNNIKYSEDIEKIFQKISLKYLNKDIKLNDYLKVDENYEFIKNIAYTIRCGGRKSPINSKQNWDGYYLKHQTNEDLKEYRLTVSDMQWLQGFNKEFKLIGTETEKQRLLGNTIPTNLTTLICDMVNKIIKTDFKIP